MDFATFGPYGKRLGKLRRFEATILVDHQWVTRMLSGPATFEAWMASWELFKTSLICLGGATPGALDRYATGLRTLVTLYPNAWGVILVADETMRSERWDLVLADARRKRPDFHTPWNFVLRETAFSAEGSHAHWWFTHVTGPLQAAGHAGALGLVQALEGSSWSAAPIPPGLPSLGQPAGDPTIRPLGRRPANFCPRWNAGTCEVLNCPLRHRCSGCSGLFPCVRCWTCDPSLKGSGKGKGKSSFLNDAAQDAQITTRKKRRNRGGKANSSL